LDAIDSVEEVTAVHIEAATAQTPIGAQEEVKPENPEVFFVQIPLCQEVKIGHVFFVIAAPNTITLRAGTCLKRGTAQMLGLFNALAELR